MLRRDHQRLHEDLEGTRDPPRHVGDSFTYSRASVPFVSVLSEQESVDVPLGCVPYPTPPTSYTCGWEVCH